LMTADWSHPNRQSSIVPLQSSLYNRHSAIRCLGSGDGMPDIGMESSVAPDYVKEPAEARRAKAN